MYQVGIGALQVGTTGACGFTDLGVLKGECWCASVGQSVCNFFMGAGSYDNALRMIGQAHGVPAYPPMQQPPALSAPSYPGETPQEISDRQIREWQAQNQAYFERIPIDAGGGQPGETNWLLWGGIAAAALFGMVAMGGGRPRRYGR